MSTLYRKYRPQSFSEVFGQNHIKIALENELTGSSLASAYIFCGPRAVGKTTLARLLGKAANCRTRQTDSSEPCNTCPSCVSITAGNNLEFIEIDAASQTGVDNVRDNVIAAARIAPSQNLYKVFIIDEVHMLSISAFNALLKLLEEPPLRTIFILCTTEIHKVPETIISRCQRFDFKRISLHDMVKKLEYILLKEKIDAEPGVLESIARRSDGYLRDAESLLGQIIALGEGQVTAVAAELVIPRGNFEEASELFACLFKKEAAKAIRLVNSLADSGVSLKNFISDVLVVGRKLLLSKAGPGLAESFGLDFGEGIELRLSELASEFDLPKLVLIMEKMLAASNALKTATISTLPLEIAIAELCSDVAVSKPTMATSQASVSFGSPRPPKTETTAINEPEPVKKSRPEPASLPAPDPTLELSVSHIEARWNEVLIKIKNYNHSLSFILQASAVKGVKEGRLYLVFKYKFHRDRLMSAQIKADFEDILAEVYQHRIALLAEVDENLVLASNSPTSSSSAPTAPASVPSSPVGDNNSDALSSLLSAFGGEIVN